MKVGTVPKITAGVVAIIVLAFIGTRQFISSKEDSSSSVEVATSTPTESANSLAQTEAARKDAATTPSREDKPQISAAEMQQIEDFFAQLEGANPQSEMDTPQSPADTEVTQNTDEHIITGADAFAEDLEQTAEEVMNVFVEAFRNMDFEAIRPLLTGTAKEKSEYNVLEAQENGIALIDSREIVVNLDGVPSAEIDIEKIGRQMAEVMMEVSNNMLNQAEVVSSGHVGDEFYFRLEIPVPEYPAIPGMQPPDMIQGPQDKTIKMRRENDVWRIYEIH